MIGDIRPFGYFDEERIIRTTPVREQLRSYEESKRVKQIFERKCKNVIKFIFPPFKFRAWRDRWFGRTVDPEINEDGQELIDAIDDSVYDDMLEHGFEPDMHSTRGHYSYISHVVKLCKQENPGIHLIENLSTRLVAERWLAMAMKDHGMRPSHIDEMLPLAVEAVFIPTKHQVRAKKLRQSRPVALRLEEANTRYQTRTAPWLFNWFGSVVHRPDPGAA